jgi:hypothetical protein
VAYRKLTKLEIAELQLLHAIDLYVAGEHLISVITLAGAAEEILGKLVERKGAKNALNETVVRLGNMFERVFKEPANLKEFVTLRTKARNELKHIGTEDSIELDLEQEAVNLLDRAIDNYKILKPGIVKKFREFERERVRRYRELTQKDA